MKRYLGLLILALALFGGSTFVFQFGTKKDPSDYRVVQGTGVTYLKNPFAELCSPYYLLHSLAVKPECHIYNNDGALEYSIPARFCSFLSEETLLTFYAQELKAIDHKKGTLWTFPTSMTSNIHVNAARKELAFAKKETHTANNISHRYDSVEVIDFNGKAVFTWSTFKNRDHLIQREGVNALPKNNSTGAESLKINSVYILPKNELSQKIPPFQEGNLLVNFETLKKIVIINRQSGRIVWSYSYSPGIIHSPTLSMDRPESLMWFRNLYSGLEPLELGATAPKGYFVPKDREMIFKNVINPEDGRTEAVAVGQSRIEKIHPEHRKVIWEYTGTSPLAFYSYNYGSAHECANGNILVSHNTFGGSVMEIRPPGEIVWEFINPQKDPYTQLPATLIDASPVSATAVENFRAVFQKN